MVPTLTKPSTKPSAQHVLTRLAMVVIPSRTLPRWHIPTLPCTTSGQADYETWQVGGPHSNPATTGQRVTTSCKNWDATPTPFGKRLVVGRSCAWSLPNYHPGLGNALGCPDLTTAKPSELQRLGRMQKRQGEFVAHFPHGHPTTLLSRQPSQGSRTCEPHLGAYFERPCPYVVWARPGR